MVLGNFPSDLGYSGARIYCGFRRLGLGLFGYFLLSSIISLSFSFSLSLGNDQM